MHYAVFIKGPRNALKVSCQNSSSSKQGLSFFYLFDIQMLVFFLLGGEVQVILEDILTLQASSESAAQQRTDAILKVLGAAEKFFFDFLAVSEALHDLRDQVASQGPLAATPDAIRNQKTDIQVCSIALFAGECLFLST